MSYIVATIIISSMTATVAFIIGKGIGYTKCHEESVEDLVYIASVKSDSAEVAMITETATVNIEDTGSISRTEIQNMINESREEAKDEVMVTE